MCRQLAKIMLPKSSLTKCREKEDLPKTRRTAQHTYTMQQGHHNHTHKTTHMLRPENSRKNTDLPHNNWKNTHSVFSLILSHGWSTRTTGKQHKMSGEKRLLCSLDSQELHHRPKHDPRVTPPPARQSFTSVRIGFSFLFTPPSYYTTPTSLPYQAPVYMYGKPGFFHATQNTQNTKHKKHGKKIDAAEAISEDRDFIRRCLELFFLADVGVSM